MKLHVRRQVHRRVPSAVFAIAFLSALFSCAGSTAQPARSEPDNLLVGSFNIHYTPSHREDMKWEERRHAVAKVLEETNVDLLAFQEMETFEGGSFNTENIQLEWLRRYFEEYKFGSVGNPEEYPSTQPIMYRIDRIQHVEQGFFFFSETPDRIYSRSWDGRFPAYCSWSRFRDRRTGTTFYLYNVHFDAGSRGNRLNSAALVRERIESRTNPEDPVILAGDINAPWFFKPARMLRDAGLRMADTQGSTFHFYRGFNVLPAIDHVFVSAPLAPIETWVVRKRHDGIWPSDHYPLVVEISTNE